jgi:hypothetical protein
VRNFRSLLQHSNIPLGRVTAQPSFSDLAQRTRFSRLEKNTVDAIWVHLDIILRTDHDLTPIFPYSERCDTFRFALTLLGHCNYSSGEI